MGMDPTIGQVLVSGGAAVAGIVAFGFAAKWIMEGGARLIEAWNQKRLIEEEDDVPDVNAPTNGASPVEARVRARLSKAGADRMVAAEIAVVRARLNEIQSLLQPIVGAMQVNGRQSEANHHLLVEIDKKLDLLIDRDNRSGPKRRPGS